MSAILDAVRAATGRLGARIHRPSDEMEPTSARCFINPKRTSSGGNVSWVMPVFYNAAHTVALRHYLEVVELIVLLFVGVALLLVGNTHRLASEARESAQRLEARIRRLESILASEEEAAASQSARSEVTPSVDDTGAGGKASPEDVDLSLARFRARELVTQAKQRALSQLETEPEDATQSILVQLALSSSLDRAAAAWLSEHLEQGASVSDVEEHLVVFSFDPVFLKSNEPQVVL